MSLYNILHGVNSNTVEVLDLIGLTVNEIARFRDVWIDKDCEHVVVFTRLGGGNRECWCEEEEHSCHQKDIEFLLNHSGYVRDWDDDFDSTYAYFKYKVPRDKQQLTKVLLASQNPEFQKSLGERFGEVMAEVKKMTAEQLIQKYPEICRIINEIADTAKNTNKE